MFLIGVAIVVLALPLLVRWRLKSHWHLDPLVARRLKRTWQDVQRQSDPHLQVLEAEKAFEVLLGAWKLQGTFAEKLKQASWRIPEADAVWSAHRLRNRIAHEPGIRVAPDEAQRAISAYERVITRYL